MSMLADVIQILQQLGVLGAVQFIAIAISAIFIYRYFTDR